MKSWVKTLSYCFKVSTSIALDLFTNETFSLDDVQVRRLLAQYVCAIMRHSIGCNIVDVANQLFFAY